MEDINETYKVLGKITFCRKLVWTFGNEEEERSPEVLKAHWWNTMKKVFDEHGVYFINVWLQKIWKIATKGICSQMWIDTVYRSSINTDNI